MGGLKYKLLCLLFITCYTDHVTDIILERSADVILLVLHNKPHTSEEGISSFI